MRNKFLICLLAIFLPIPVSFAQAQDRGKIPRLGYLTGFKNTGTPGSQDEAFWQGLRDRGYAEGKNVFSEIRVLEGNIELYPKPISELIDLKVDVLVIAGSLSAIRMAKQATKTIPIVIITTQDPVARGFVQTLARPGGNITGVTTLLRELSGKRLEVFKEAVPGITRVAALANTIQLGQGLFANNDFRWYEEPAQALKIQLLPIGLKPTNPDFEGGFQAAIKARANGLITVSGSLMTPHLRRIAELAIKNRLPSMHERSDYVEAGGLMSYAASDAASYRRAADYVDRILKGAKPADLPIEQPTKFELVINLKTAKQIGLTIPQKVLARADRVIK
jgi:putative tryptophan/tyrosine transport system substrate-binding protein